MAKILMIDDDAELCMNVAECLEEAGHTVEMLNDYEDAMITVLRDKPELIILDVMFPENPVAGLEVARLVRNRKETRHLPVLMLTGVNQEFPADLSAADVGGRWLPAKDFLEKPFDAGVLVDTVNRLLAK